MEETKTMFGTQEIPWGTYKKFKIKFLKCHERLKEPNIGKTIKNWTIQPERVFELSQKLKFSNRDTVWGERELSMCNMKKKKKLHVSTLAS